MAQPPPCAQSGLRLSDPRNILSSCRPQVPPHSPPLTNLLGDGLRHGTSCTGHKPEVHSKVALTLSLLELRCGWEAGWLHFRSIPRKPESPPDISPRHPLPQPKALSSLPPSTTIVWALPCHIHSPQSLLTAPLAPSCSSDLFNQYVLSSERSRCQALF